MSGIGSPERVTQNRVVALFRDELEYLHLGDRLEALGVVRVPSFSMQEKRAMRRQRLYSLTSSRRMTIDCDRENEGI